MPFLMLFIPSCIFIFLSGPISFCMKNTLQNSSDACLLLVNSFGFLFIILKTSLPLFCIDNQQQCFIFKPSCEHLLTSTWLSFGVICLDLFGPAWVILLCHIQPSGSTKMGTLASFHHSHPHSPFLTGLPCSTWTVYLLIFWTFLFFSSSGLWPHFTFSSLVVLLCAFSTVAWLSSWLPPWLLPKFSSSCTAFSHWINLSRS